MGGPTTGLDGLQTQGARSEADPLTVALVPELCDEHGNDGGRFTPPLGPAIAAPATLLVSIVILSKTIIGAGLASLPRSFLLLGWGTALAFLLAVAYLTHVSVKAIALGRLTTGKTTFPGIVEALHGKALGVLLEVCLVFRGAGLLIVYLIVIADILAGHKGSQRPGMACDLLGHFQGCDSRAATMAVVTVFILIPLVSAKRLASTAVASWIGLAAVLLWTAVTAVACAIAWVKGLAHAVPLLPDWDALGAGWSTAVSNLLGVIPIIATAYTCQMTVTFVMDDMGSAFSEARVATASAAAVAVCSVVFAVVGIGAPILFGADVADDVLENFSASGLRPLVGAPTARILDVLVRLGFLLSILGVVPAQMWPYRAALGRLVLRRDLDDIATLRAISYVSLAIFCALALRATSIWLPIQLVGATAGAVIAFFLPGAVALRARGADATHRTYWTAWGSALVALGAVQLVCGTAAALML